MTPDNSAIRGLLWALGMECFVVVVAVLFYFGHRVAGISLAVIAIVWTAAELVRAIRLDRRERMRRGREAVWQRRIGERPGVVVVNHQPVVRCERRPRPSFQVIDGGKGAVWPSEVGSPE